MGLQLIVLGEPGEDGRTPTFGLDEWLASDAWAGQLAARTPTGMVCIGYIADAGLMSQIAVCA